MRIVELVKLISKMAPGRDGRYHISLAPEALTCIVRFVEIWFPAKPRAEPLPGKTSDDMFI